MASRAMYGYEQMVLTAAMELPWSLGACCVAWTKSSNDQWMTEASARISQATGRAAAERLLRTDLQGHRTPRSSEVSANKYQNEPANRRDGGNDTSERCLYRSEAGVLRILQIVNELFVIICAHPSSSWLMLSAMQSPSTAHDEHVRRLLDQRTARADLHNRFPSYADSYDSPSIYSHPVFSPRPGRSADQPQSSNYASSTLEPRSPMSDRERLNDPSASTLDLEDDPRYSYASQDYSDDDHSSEHTIDDDDDDGARMSVLGPKMRFHSRAPWEMGEEAVAEEEEPDSNALSRTLSEPRSEKNRGGIMKGLGLNRVGSSGRPSNDSSRSSGKTKQSFETNSSYISPGGALHALAQASMSSTSLAAPCSPKSTARNKFPMMRVHTQPGPSIANPSQHSSPASPRVAAISDGSSPRSGSDSHVPPLSRRGRSASPAPSPITHQQEYIHPYANPDLAFYNQTYESSRSPSHQQRAFMNDIPPSDSDQTVTEASTSGSWTSAGVITPDSSATSVAHKAKGSYSSGESMHVKGVSAPVATRRPSVPDSHSSFESIGRPFASTMQARTIAGWQDTPASPGFTLISLEEAQAQVRERSRTTTTQVAMSQHGHGNSPLAFPAADNSAVDQRMGSSKNSNSPTGSTFTSRARARSISAGARAKNAFLPRGKDSEYPAASSEDHASSEAPPRVIKQKKSGFMRLFRDKEKDKPQPQAVPPVPQISSEVMGDNGSGNQTYMPAPRTTKDLKRVPVPSLSASLLAESDGMLRVTPSDDERRKYSPSPRRGNLPTLSIIPPGGHSSSKEPFNPEVEQERGRSRATTPTVALSAVEASSGVAAMCPSPRSAPPGQTDFRGLSLRPVSTAFSAHFSDHLIPGEVGSARANGDSDLDLDTPTTMNTAITSPSTSNSPLGYSFRSDDSVAGNRGVSIAVAGDDQSAVIQALQDQIVSARKGWQMQIWELEGQVRELKAELERLRAAGNRSGYCDVCGRGSSAPAEKQDDGGRTGVMNRPRAPTSGGGRFGCIN
ncbi:hypothetical protein OE88DRAFT_1640773 [Heliocybe sulcata]|uniref:Uncharacterized protein n=1 Tax=Heliocybe sulcata TaxID=5364 RepID=A0A5C3NLE2_9AGAM|nr:hypothetical protein OE88DRAFT_1640773 [Heliocybe sulcata]